MSLAEPSARLEVEQPGKPRRVFAVDEGVYTLGSDPDCRICLPCDDVESRHAILTVRQGEFWVEDLDTRSGTYVDGVRVHGRRQVGAGQAVRIGPFELRMSSPESAVREEPLPDDAARPVAAEVGGEPGTSAEDPTAAALKQRIQRELLSRLDLKRLIAGRAGKEELKQRALQTLESIVGESAGRLPAGLDAATLIREIYNEAVGLGPLEDFLADPDISEIMVNGPSQVYVERQGRLVLTGKTFSDDNSVQAIIERIVSPLGRRIDESQPYVDARLPDGSRVNAIIPPLSLVGPCLTIRKFAKTPFTDQDLVRLGTLNPFIADFTRVCVLLRKNIIVSGGTGSGKTTLLNVLSSYLPSDERIVTIEDAAELRLRQSHVVKLEARPPNIEGKGAVTIRDLVRNALRMRPDRIVVGECRGGEALDMLQAMNTGHDGSLTTVHANSPRDVISRLETMVLMSGMELPIRAIREQVAAAIDLIVHTARFSDGTRKIARISEVVGLEGERITMQDIFEFKQTAVRENGQVVGEFAPTGAVPTFIDELGPRGLSVNRAMFDPQKWKTACS